MVLNGLAVGALVFIGYAALFGLMFNPWYTVYSALKGFIVKYLCVCGAGLAVYYVYVAARRPAALESCTRSSIRRAVRLLKGRAARLLAGGGLLGACLLPFIYLHRDTEVKHALTQFSELAKVELDLVKSTTGTGKLLHAGESPHNAPDYHPCPGPWKLTRGGNRILPARVNYIFVCVDALRGDVFNRVGNPRADLTPFFDRWTAEECVFFEHAYCQGNGTFNSLPVLMGGRGDRRDLVPGVDAENAFYKLTVSEGVDRRYSFEGHGIRYLYPPVDPQFVSLGVPYFLGFSNHDHSVRAADCFERVKKAVSELSKEQTFFVYVHLMDVHNDLYLKQEANYYGDKPEDLYANNVNYLDRCMRGFIGWLKSAGRYDNTVIVFTSDHGEAFGEHVSTMHGANFYQEDIYVPLILRLPGVGARTIRTPVTTSDLTPTLIDMAGWRFDPPYDDPGVGVSIRDLVLDEGRHGERFTRRDIFLHSCFTEKYGLLRDGRYKFVYWVTYESYVLFDLVEDPGERHNIVDERRDLASDMKRVLLNELRRIRGIGYAARLPWE